MHPTQKQYVTSESGTKIAVQLDIRSFQQLEEYVELLEDRIDLELAMKGSLDLTNWDGFVKELREDSSSEYLYFRLRNESLYFHLFP